MRRTRGDANGHASEPTCPITRPTPDPKTAPERLVGGALRYRRSDFAGCARSSGCPCSPATRREDERPGAGRFWCVKVVIDKVKRPAGIFTFEAVLSHEDNAGAWLYLPAGTAWR